jgi:penicillin-binding protein 1B
LQKDVPVYPSMLLGAFELTPFEVANIYQTIAADGQQLSLHAIRSVLSNDEKPMVRFAEEHEYTINKDIIYLLKTMLHDVTRSGTAKSLAQYPFKVAGKTGTTDDTRDSWFAGFSQDKLAVVWVGNDDNLTTGLTGASGALKLWTSIFRHISFTDLDLTMPDTIESYRVDKRSGLLAGFGCNNTIELVFLRNVRPTQDADCF